MRVFCQSIAVAAALLLLCKVAADNSRNNDIRSASAGWMETTTEESESFEWEDDDATVELKHSNVHQPDGYLFLQRVPDVGHQFVREVFSPPPQG